MSVTCDATRQNNTESPVSHLSFALRTISVLLLLALCVVGVRPDAAGAQTTAGFTVSPPIWDFAGSRGQTIERTYTLSNAGNIDFPIATEVRNFTADPTDGAQAQFTNDVTGYEMKSYVTVSPDRFVLQPKSTADIKVTVRIPQDASPGGHFGAITFHQGAAPQSGNVKVDQAVTSLLLLNVAGDVVNKLELTKLSANGDTVFGVHKGDTITFDSAFNNAGNVHQQPDMTFEAQNLIGRDHTIRKQTPGYTLPGTTRTYKTEWEPPALPGIYKVKLTASYVGGEPLTKTTTVVVLPPSYAVGLLVFLVLVGLLIVVRRKKRHRAAHSRKAKKPTKFTVSDPVVDSQPESDE